MNVELSRLEEARTNNVPWKMWGPYLSERQRGSRIGKDATARKASK